LQDLAGTFTRDLHEASGHRDGFFLRAHLDQGEASMSSLVSGSGASVTLNPARERVPVVGRKDRRS
jgi:hypothetical protein